MSHYVVVLSVLLSLLHPRPCAGQDNERTMSPRIARELLASSSPTEQAWGAWMAGRLLMMDVTPQIERVISAGLASQNIERWARVSVGLDALIEIGAKPAVQILTDAHALAPVQSLILLSRLDSAANRILLAMMADSDGYPWFAAANLLKQRKASGFAALLLKDLELTAEVVVSRDGTQGAGVEGGVSGSVGDKAFGIAEGYPPLTDYEFRSCSGPNRLLLAAGPTNVCYEKARPSLSSHGIGGPDDDDRLAYFRSEWSPALKRVETMPIAWTSDNATKAALADVVKRVGLKYAAAIARLKDLGWLTGDEVRALAQPRIHESIRDVRPQ